MKYEELPLHIPLVKIASFEEWQKKFSKNGALLPNYRTINTRLVMVQSKLLSDPINYIVNISKKENLSDKEVADALNTLIEKTDEWTPKMVFTLRKQCGIL